jgi:hypothetical protein
VIGLNFLAGFNPDAVVMLLLGITAAMFMILMYLLLSLSGLKERYNSLMKGKDGKSLEEMFSARLGELEEARRDIRSLKSGQSELTAQLALCVQKMGVVRFNAFEDTGGDLSFAIALLDEKDNGCVISSIYGRSEARCYAKPVAAGQSLYALSGEEKQAIIEARHFVHNAQK